MAGVNKVILIGNVGNDPQIKILDGGVKVANFSLATSESYRDKSGNKIENTTWHKLVLWKGLAEISEKYLKKGSKIFVEGKIQNRTWTDKEGVKQYTTEILVDSLTMLGKKDVSTSSESSTNVPAKDNSSSHDTNDHAGGNPNDDLPF